MRSCVIKDSTRITDGAVSVTIRGIEFYAARGGLCGQPGSHGSINRSVDTAAGLLARNGLEAAAERFALAGLFPYNTAVFRYNGCVTETILQTKLYIPTLRYPNLVPRPLLIQRLNQGLQQGHKLLLVCAPAGFGKTTLVVEWVHNSQATSSSPRFAWLSLDEGDNDLTRFLSHLVAALRTIEGDVGRGLLAWFQSPEAINVDLVLTTLLNKIIEVADDVVLILDDYHVIESLAVNRAITFLLDHLPPNMHLVIAGRNDPSLSLSRLRAHGQMIEIRAHDLRFTLDEAAVFLNKIKGLKLSVQDIAALEKRTEGWIAGLQLAALSMQGLEGGSAIVDFVSRFTGSNRYIQDYLADEVLQQQSNISKDFLLQTSILSRLNAPLCDAVTGRNNSQALLENLESANLFIVPLDNKRCWYRYHHLFAGLLTHRLSHTFPNRIHELHRRASMWYENEGYTDEAINHARAAADNERVAEILEERWQDIIHRGEVTRLQQWLDSLGPEFTKRSAPLNMAYCWIHVMTGDNASIASRLKNIRAVLGEGAGIESGQQPMRMAVLPSLVETMEATVALDGKRAGKAKEHAQRAIALIPEDANLATRNLLQGAAAYRLAEAHRELGEYDQAYAILLEGLEMLKASENYFGTAAILLRIVAMFQESGRAAEAAILCEETLDYMAENNWVKMLPSGLVNVMLADLQADSGDFDEARKNLELGRRLVEQINSQQLLDLVSGVDEKLAHRTLPPQPLIDPLSPRELEVLQLIAQGLSNREISERLFLALDTVKGHNRRIFEKLGVNNRTRAVNKANSLRIISL